ncbi:MAG: SPFH domain-containing protein [Clostridia bacterium]|nr:SPFH domain-containing protein [Clostridia bacterium]
MGLIKAAVGAVGSTLHDQWKEAIRCEDLGNDILMKKKTTPTGVITNKSTIIVAPGQCAIIYDNGKVIDATAEEGFYTFDNSSSPSFFAGQFGEVFKEMWQRFTYNGATAKEQAVFFFNIKEIVKNKFGTPAPVPFQDWSHGIPNEMTGTFMPLGVKVKCFGTYTFRLVNPAAFMNNIAGTSDTYRVSDLTEQIRAEVVAAFQNVLNELGNSVHKVPVLELPSQTDEIKQMMDEKVFDEPIRRRGLQIEVFAVESVTLDADSERKIEEYEHNANSRMQQGRVLSVMETAAKNPNGSANGFMGVGMMNMTTGGLGTGVMQNAFNQQQAPVNQAVQQNVENTTSTVSGGAGNSSNEWICPNCGKPATGKFCGECGTKKPEANVCPNCGTKLNEGTKFCGECGTKIQ